MTPNWQLARFCDSVQSAAAMFAEPGLLYRRRSVSVARPSMDMRRITCELVCWSADERTVNRICVNRICVNKMLSVHMMNRMLSEHRICVLQIHLFVRLCPVMLA